MNDDRPYIRKPSAAPPRPDDQSVTAGVQSARWTRRRPESPQLRAALAALRAMLASHKEGGVS
jgi:hypothetical protein